MRDSRMLELVGVALTFLERWHRTKYSRGDSIIQSDDTLRCACPFSRVCDCPLLGIVHVDVQRCCVSLLIELIE